MWVFSAFRTHKMQRDIAKYLLNEKGELKPFTKFVKDVAPYIKHTNRLWLETEYNTAVLRAHQAADWRKFVDERDVLPNLEWQPSTSTNPGEDHKPYWFTCLPIDHKFWKQHRPGDRWNCKCSLRNTDKEPTPVPADTIIKGSEPQRGLESNPGTTGEIFSDNHPYFPENCGKCPFNKGVGKLFAALVGKGIHCGDCKKMAEICGNAGRKPDVTDMLRELSTQDNKEFGDTLNKIIESNEFKQLEDNDNIFVTQAYYADPDREHLTKAAQKALFYKNTVYILPNPNGFPSADYIFKNDKNVKLYDLKWITGKKSVETDLRESVNQSNRVLLYMAVDYDARDMAEAIKGYFTHNKFTLEVLIFKGKQKISVPRDKALNKNFIKLFIKEWGKKR